MLASNNEISARPIDAVSRVRLMLDAYMRFGLENPNTYRLAFCTARLELAGATREGPADLAARCCDRFMRSVAEASPPPEGRLRLGDANSAAQTLWAACHGLVSLRINHMKPDPAEDEALMGLMLDSLFQGMVID